MYEKLNKDITFAKASMPLYSLFDTDQQSFACSGLE